MPIKITQHITAADLKEMNQKAWRQTVMDLQDLIFQRSQEILSSFVHTGELLGSGSVWFNEEPSGFVTGFIGYDAPHALPIEFGSSPHWPPRDPIREWVRLKLGKRGKELERVTGAVMAKIAKLGTDPHPYFRPAIELAEPEMPGLYRKNLSKEMT